MYMAILRHLSSFQAETRKRGERRIMENLSVN